jgi:hypothetical protein
MLITETSTEILVKGQYKTDKYVYNINYTHSDGKLISMGVQILDLNGQYLGSSNIGNGTSSVTVNDPSTLQEHTDIIAQLYTEVLATVGNKQD